MSLLTRPASSPPPMRPARHVRGGGRSRSSASMAAHRLGSRGPLVPLLLLLRVPVCQHETHTVGEKEACLHSVDCFLQPTLAGRLLIPGAIFIKWAKLREERSLALRIGRFLGTRTSSVCAREGPSMFTQAQIDCPPPRCGRRPGAFQSVREEN